MKQTKQLGELWRIIQTEVNCQQRLSKRLNYNTRFHGGKIICNIGVISRFCDFVLSGHNRQIEQSQQAVLYCRAAPSLK